MSVDDARARAAMRLYGRQRRARARRRRVVLSLGIVAALLAVPLAHLVSQRGAVVHGVRVAGVPLGGAARAQAEREISAAVGDELQRDVTVTVAGRSAAVSPYDLGVRVAARTAGGSHTGRVRGGPLFRSATRARFLPCCATRSPALPVDLANVTRRSDARLVLAERRSHRRAPGPVSASIQPRALRAITRAALADGPGLVAHRARPGRDLDRGGAPRQGPCRASAVGADRVHPTWAGGGPLARTAPAPLLTATTYRHVIGVQPDPRKVGAALRPARPVPSPCQGCELEGAWGSRARALPRSPASTSPPAARLATLTTAGGHTGSARVARSRSRSRSRS
jgi:hypothetical protein